MRNFTRCELFDMFVNNSYDGIMISDATGKVLFVNEATCESLGMTEENIVGKCVHDLIDEGAYSNSPTLKTIETKEPHTEIISTRIGNRLSTSIPIFDENGELEIILINNRSDLILNEFLKQLTNEQRQRKVYKDIISHLSSFGEQPIVYESKEMDMIVSNCETIASASSSVMITGESGVGKELVAKLIHQLSDRSKEAFIPVNCSAIPGELFESEFFGYVAGAFTGSSPKGKTGLIQMAHKGTLFLDELGELPPLMQSKLLRFIENGEIYPVGSTAPVKVDVRIISATNCDLMEMVKKKEFREDLYYRLHVIPIHIPPLRERPDDIYSIAQFFIRTYNQKYNKKTILTEEDRAILEDYSWPGNIRELRNVIEHTVIMSGPGYETDFIRNLLEIGRGEQARAEQSRDSREVSVRNDAVNSGEDISQEVDIPYDSIDGMSLKEATAEFQRAYIDRIIEKNKYNLTKAARELGVHRSTLYRKKTEE